jgi:hypothetical protein
MDAKSKVNRIISNSRSLKLYRINVIICRASRTSVRVYVSARDRKSFVAVLMRRLAQMRLLDLEQANKLASKKPSKGGIPPIPLKNGNMIFVE